MAAKNKPAVNTNKWQQLLDQMAEKGGNGSVFFPKKGKTRIRLAPIKGTDDDFFVETKSVYKGKARSKYLLSAMVISTDAGELNERWVNKVVPVLVPGAVLKGILGLLAEGYDLLSPEGHGITIVKTGGGLETTYSVMPSQKPMELPDDVTYPEQSFEEIAEEYANRADSADETSDDEAPRAGKSSATESSGADW